MTTPITSADSRDRQLERAGGGQPHRLWRLTSIGGLTIGQVIPAAFVTAALPTIFRKNGLDLEQFWVFSLPLIPVWFKWMWAPLVDRYGSTRFGRRRSWLVPCTLIGAGAYAALSFVEPEPSMVWLLVGILTLRSLVIATQDIAADAYIIESLGPSERKVGSSVVTLAEIAANLSAVAGLMWVYDRYGWDLTVFAAAGALILFTLPALTREPLRSVQAAAPSIRTFLRRPESPTIIAAILFITFAITITTVIDGAFLVDKGLSVAEVGFVLGVGQLAGYLLGVVGSPLVSSLLKPRSSMALAIILVPLALVPPIALSLLPTVDAMTAAVAFGLGAVGYGHLYVLYNAARFDWANTGQGGTDYAIQSSLARVAVSACTAVAGVTAGTIGWTGFYCAALVLVFTAALFFAWSSGAISAHRANRVDAGHARPGDDAQTADPLEPRVPDAALV